MPEAFHTMELPTDKAARYARVGGEIAAVLLGETNALARMATIVAMLSSSFDHYLWTGFYLVDPEREGELVIGPYQGALACLRIALGRGVCGTAAQTREIQVVDDVHAFPGHIACDSRAASEIVVPVIDASGRLIGVLDVDSSRPAAFDRADAEGLDQILRETFA